MRPHLIQKLIWTAPGVVLRRQTASLHLRRNICAAAVDPSADHGPPSLELIAASPLATQLVAHYFAASLAPGDAYLLYGEVGAGKSYFSRAFVRAALGDESAPVPSPTFLLQNTYPLGPDSPSVNHYDLYRLGSTPQDLSRLDLGRALPAAVSLIEWAERLGAAAPLEHLALRISIVGDAERAGLEARGLSFSQKGSCLDDEDQDDEEENDSGNGDDSGDRRWRRLELWPKGERWAGRVGELKQHVAARGAALGLLLLDSSVSTK